MDESKWIQVFFLSMLFTGAISESVVRAGGDVTLSCENVIKDQRTCNSTTWLYSYSSPAAVAVFEHGQIKTSRSDRLSVTSDCSLVLKNVSAQDAGQYICREFVSKPHRDAAVVQLSVVTLTQQQLQDRVTLSCSVSIHERCKHKVKWLINGSNVEKNHPVIKESPPSPCSAAVTFTTSHFIFTPNFEFFKCEVESEDKKVTHFTFSSDESTAGSGGNAEKPNPVSSWWYISVAVVAVIVIISVIFILLRRTKGIKSQKPSSEGESSNPAVIPAERKQERVEPEEGLSYASISYAPSSSSSSSSSRVKNGEEDVSVTYSTVKAPPIDLNSLYASVIR